MKRVFWANVFGEDTVIDADLHNQGSLQIISHVTLWSNVLQRIRQVPNPHSVFQGVMAHPLSRIFGYNF
jgi:hypothetical protein